MNNFGLIVPPTPSLEETLRDRIATTVFEQIIIDNGMKDIAHISKDSLDKVSKSVSKIAHDFADDFMRERYERMCVKATGINLEDLVKK